MERATMEMAASLKESETEHGHVFIFLFNKNRRHFRIFVNDSQNLKASTDCSLISSCSDSSAVHSLLLTLRISGLDHVSPNLCYLTN